MLWRLRDCHGASWRIGRSSIPVFRMSVFASFTLKEWRLLAHVIGLKALCSMNVQIL